jgi:hypothetical protein
MSCTHFNEVKDALLDAIDEINKTSFQLKKAPEEYYFQIKIKFHGVSVMTYVLTCKK